MVFSSPVFLFIFFPLVLLGYFAIPKSFRGARNVFLLLSSLLFYAWGEPKFVFYMVIVVLGNYILGLLAAKFLYCKKKLKIVVAATVVLNVSFLFYFKYLNFTFENLKKIGIFNEEIIKIALPIGISFFTFQAMSYVFDISLKRAEVQKNPLNVLLYVCLFPQLVAGPIVRFQTVANELNQRNENFEDFAEGVRRFIVGLGKKCIIANSLAPTADFCFNNIAVMEKTMAVGSVYAGGGVEGLFYISWIGAIAYTLQIYFDFSGYSDMAIGLGRMFGFHFEENFNYPYIAKSVSDFWRRWHISMGTWFRDYLYFPLGGSRVGTSILLIRNLFIVWLATGIWHGANWTFIVWGLWHFLWITLEKVFNFPRSKEGSLKSKCYCFLTLIIVIVGWVFFRSNTLTDAVLYLKCMFLPFTLENSSLRWSFAAEFLIKDCAFILLLGILFSSPTLFKAFNKLPSFVTNVFYITIFLLSIAFSLTSSYDPFIYFNF